jgi:2'-5' RNA ligase
VAREAPSKQRLFVALDLPEHAREQVVAWQHEVLAPHSRSLRLVRAEALHVTLIFLGHLAEDPIGVVASTAFGGVPNRAPLFEVQGLKPVPPRRPRLWALDLADHRGRAGRMQAAMSARLADRALYTPEKRPFWAHLTVARLRAGARPPLLSVPPPPLRFTSSQAVLYRSHLSRAGAAYEALSNYPLKP